MILQSNYDQQTAFRAFLHQKVPYQSRGRVLPLWYQAFYLPNVSELGVLYLAGGIVSLMLYYGPEHGANNYSFWSAFFTAAHLIFSKFAWDGLQGFSDARAPFESTEKALRGWLMVSLARLVVADGPAWVFATLALTHSIRS
ncbi:hypothetical protein VD0002_g3054 [Verticillium dahliae]|uniref:Uncharacterized protein n=1 Tax=Verticillium dahliae TaxID=27337 RepID=A0AA44WB02_VERDA|nr:hypothetical protein BJF96_g8384 [Verticillium dahliae]PNH66246.1 hypothetical protein VD0002_g3054 [Verticillium dahliae]